MLWETSVTCDSTDLQVTKPKSTGNDCCLEGPQHEMPLQTKKVLYFQGRSGFQSSKHLLSTLYDQHLFRHNKWFYWHAWQWKMIPIKKKIECTLWLRRTHLEFSLHLPFLGRDVMTVYKQAPLNTQTSVVHSLLFNQAQCFSIVIVTKNYDYIPIWLIAFLLYQQFYSSNKQLHS